jgi:porphobilinogen synthase
MPGNFQLSIDNLIEEVEEIKSLGIPAVLLFGIPAKKDNLASPAYSKEGIIQQAIRQIKRKISDIVVITDVCVCGYTSHGHCGVVKKSRSRGSWGIDYEIDNSATLELLAKVALSHAKAGCDMVAPSSMMDGQVFAVRQILDVNGYENLPLMAYSAKFASSFYGPFREAAESPPKFGNRRSYQMDLANSDEALREVRLDLCEGADIVIVKPALPYLDIIQRVRKSFNIPLAAYNVSGEFAMVKAAAQKKWLDEKGIILEIMHSIKRAGADIIITYHAKQVASWLTDNK